MKVHKIFLVFLLTNMVVQTTNSASLEDINNWFKRIKKGTECVINRKQCDPEDTKAMYQAAGGIAATLALVASGATVILIAKKVTGSAAEKQTLKNQFANDVSVIQIKEAWDLWRKQNRAFQKELAQHRGDDFEPMLIVALDALQRYMPGELGPKDPQDTKQPWQDLSYHLNLIGGMLHAGAKDLMTQDELKDAQDTFEVIRLDLLSPHVTLSADQQERIKIIGNELKK